MIKYIWHDQLFGTRQQQIGFIAYYWAIIHSTDECRQVLTVLYG